MRQESLVQLREIQQDQHLTMDQLLAPWKPEEISALNRLIQSLGDSMEDDDSFDDWLTELRVAVILALKNRRRSAALALAPVAAEAPPTPARATPALATPTPATPARATPARVTPAPATSAPATPRPAAQSPTTLAPALSPPATPAPATPSPATLPSATLTGPVPMAVDDVEFPTHVPVMYRDTPPDELIAQRKAALAELQAFVKDLEENGIPEGEKIIKLDNPAELLNELFCAHAEMSDALGRETVQAMIFAVQASLDAVRMRR